MGTKEQKQMMMMYKALSMLLLLGVVTAIESYELSDDAIMALGPYASSGVCDDILDRMDALKPFLGFGWTDAFGHRSMESNSSGVYRTLKGLRNNLNGWARGMYDERKSAEKK